MDSLTQIVLGAACGQMVLGKKIGNKAFLFGAIGGTIPDVDVFIGRFLYSNEIQAMAFHRGFMHSILFAVIGAVFFGWITFKAYNSGKRKEMTTQKDWIRLFFWSIFTHPILDCFTPYGTQLFAPFSDDRVAFNNISVADPLYTLPFLICIVVALCFQKQHSKKMKWTKAGIYISSLYLFFTLGNKIYMDTVFKKSFEKAGISMDRFSAQPTIFNTILWYAVAETETQYHVTFYALFDEKSYSEKIINIDKNHALLDMSDENLHTLTWFSNGYFNLSKGAETGTYEYVDLRYPMLNPNDVNSSVFNFTISQKNNEWDILPFQGKAPTKKDLTVFMERIRGI